MTQEFYPTYGGPFIHKSMQVSPYDILRKIIEESPNAINNPSETSKVFRDAMRADPELADACFDYFHYNARTQILRLMERDRRLSKPCKKTKAELKREKVEAEKEREKYEKDKEAIRQAIKRSILDFEMPNGKLLRDCKFSEVGKFGAGFERIAKSGKPNQIVGKVLSEKDAKHLMAGR